jgi:DNA polymerase-3 subunit epsilon
MREIILDTETTGLDPRSGDRIVEIGCVETLNHMPTGEYFHCYVDPERDMPEGAFAVHGLSSEFLSDKPKFAEIVDSFLEFIGDAPLVIHNAEFDLRFLDAELTLLGRPLIDRSRSVDTVALARRRFPGAQANLDALCRRFEIDLTRREKHGALLDAELLAEVYLYLMGGRQPGLDLNVDAVKTDTQEAADIERPLRPARPHAPSSAEAEAHEALVDQITEPIWRSGLS